MSAHNVNLHHTQRNLLAYGLMAACGVVLLLLAYFVCPKDGFWYFLCKEMGFALIVALFLIATIEKFSRERHEAAAQATIEEINRNLFYSIFKRYIPEKVFEEVEKCVMESNVYRTKHELNYTIDVHENDPMLVICSAQTAYKLTSVVDAQIRHNVVVRLEVPLDPTNKDLCYIEEISINNTIVKREELTKYVKTSNEHVTLTYPIDISPRAEVSITTHSKLVKQATDVEIWSSRIPSDGLELTVSTPSKKLIVCAAANHSESLRVVINNESTQKWTLPHGIFPYQSLQFWWKPRPA